MRGVMLLRADICRALIFLAESAPDCREPGSSSVRLFRESCILGFTGSGDTGSSLTSLSCRASVRCATGAGELIVSSIGTCFGMPCTTRVGDTTRGKEG